MFFSQNRFAVVAWAESDPLLASLTDVGRASGLSVYGQLDANTLSGILIRCLAPMPEINEEA
ncbi:MAG: hypothetical protein ACI8PT_003556 [Gammaproteobacteria bacterium]